MEGWAHLFTKLKYRLSRGDFSDRSIVQSPMVDDRYIDPAGVRQYAWSTSGDLPTIDMQIST